MPTDYRAMCAELIDSLENARCIIKGADGTLHINTAEFVLRRARALLAQPVAVSERLPGPEDVNEDGNCWMWDRESCFWDWTYIRTRTRAEMYTYTHWLPYNALPNPEATNE